MTAAGIQRRHPSEDFPDEDWDEVLQVNLTSIFVLNRAIGKYFLSREPDEFGMRGKIINVGSLLNYQGGITVPAYAAAKGGLGQMSKCMSNEWIGRGICVNVIVPGYIATDMNEALINNETRARQILERIPAGRWGRPEDFKGPVVYLASNASNYVTGDFVVVDGGWMAR